MANWMRLCCDMILQYGIINIKPQIPMEYVIQAKFSHQVIKHYNDNSWHHAVGVYYGAAVQIYIDGTLAATVSVEAIHYVTE